MKKILCTLVMAAMAMSLMAVPARRGWQTMTQPDGTTIRVELRGDEFYHYWVDENGNQVEQTDEGYWQVVGAAPTGSQVAARMTAKRSARRSSVVPRMAGSSSALPTKLLVILVNFSDKSMVSSHNNAFFTNMLNQNGFSPSGSVKDYFTASSDGKYVPTFDVFGPVTLDKKMEYYGGNDSGGDDMHPCQMAYDACMKADAAGCNFANYDCNGDGTVDNVYIIYAGYGEAAGAPANTIWPHSWDISGEGLSLRLDGKKISHYACSAELSGKSGTQSDGVGTFAHEFSHVIGLPDYYDTDYGTNYENGTTPNEWSLMDGGSYNNNGQSPPLYSIFDKYFMGWATPKILKDPENVTMTTASADARQITSSNSLVAYSNTGTVYYVENRSATNSFDKYLPGTGMVVWKVQYNATRWNANDLNNTANVLRYTIVPADKKTRNFGQSTDAFPKGGTSVTPISGHEITDVALNNEVITFKYNGGIQKCTVTFNGNGKGTPASSSLTEASSGSGVTLPNVTGVTSGYTFLGWATSSTATTPDAGTAGQTYRPSSDITLYAVYKREGYVNVEYNLEGITKATGPAAGEFQKAGGFSATFTATEGAYEPLTEDNCLYEVTVNGVDKTSNYASLAGNTLTITISAANITGDIVVTIIGTKIKGVNTFERMMSSDLAAGEEVIIVCESEGKAATGMMFEKTVLDVEDVSEGLNTTDHTLELSDDSEVLVYTLSQSGSNWIFNREDGGTLGATAVKNLSFSSGTNTWTISIDGSGVATMTNTTSSYGIMRYNSGSPRFTTYASGTANMSDIQLYHRAVAVTPEDPTASFELSSITMTVGESHAQTLQTNSNGVVTYRSSDADVASVNASTGAVTAIKQGSATITADIAATKRYNAKANAAQYTVTVNRAEATLTVPSEINLAETQTQNIGAKTNSDATITYQSDATGVATVNASGLVTAKSEGTAHITVAVAQTDKYTAKQATVTVNVEKKVVYTVTWMANGETFDSFIYEPNDALVLPTNRPAACASGNRVFVGWTATENYKSANVAPTYVTAGTPVTGNATYYAVYAVQHGSSDLSTGAQTTFTEISGQVNGDSHISFEAKQGDAGTAPIANSNNDGVIRVYQNGGLFTLMAEAGYSITGFTIGSSMGTYISLSNEDYDNEYSISANGTFEKSGLSVSDITIQCDGNSKTTRLYVNYLEVTYSGGDASTTDYTTDCSDDVEVVLTDPTLSFASAPDATMTVNNQKNISVTTNSTGTVIYSSSDPSVVSILQSANPVGMRKSAGDGVTIKALKAGTATITATVTATQTHKEKSIQQAITVNRISGTASFTTSSYNKIDGDGNFTQQVTTNSNGRVTYSSNNTSAVTVNASTGEVTIVGVGTATITAAVEQTDQYTQTSATYTITVAAAPVAGTIEVTWMVDGVKLTDDVRANHLYNSGESLWMPNTTPDDCNGKQFVGWTSQNNYFHPSQAPADLFTEAGDKTVTGPVTYYAVFK